ncbi:MAG TPA: glycerophosphodiester phosphodiesterase [Acidimicrobiia bacterium]|nr:glycerophosphodiester phosphodiesterase [Acidimicrobiia bacterium]
MAPITFAHRGARLLHPENTIPAFQAALQAGAGGLETDAWLSADHEVVLTHDVRVGGPLFGLWKLRVAHTSAERLARHGVPRLATLLAELGCDYDLSIDVKDPAAAQPIIDLTRAAGDPARTWLCSPDLEQLRALRPDATDVRLVHSAPRRRLPDSLERHAADLAAAGVDAMNLRHAEWTKGLVALFHRFDRRAFAWDVQEVRHLRAMLAIGIDAVYCDHVDRMVATVAEWDPT